LGLRLAAIGAAGALALVGCSSGGSAPVQQNSEGGYGSIPAESSSSTTGGTVNVAEFPGAGPDWIFPVIDGTHSSIYNTATFMDMMYRPLYFPVTGSSPAVDYSKSLAKPPVFANNNKTITLNLNPAYKWSDGKPVTANDVIFDIDLSKAAVKESPANLNSYTPGQFPDNVTSATAPNQQTVVLTLDKTYNPDWLLYSEFVQFLVPLPSTSWNVSSAGGPHLDFTQPANAKAIYDYLFKQASTISTYATNPLWQTVDGAYKIKTYNASTNATDLVVNPAYTGPDKPKITEVDELAYTSTDAEWNDVLDGKLDVANVDFSDLPQLASAAKKGNYAYYGLPSAGFLYMYFNFKDTTGSFDKIINQLYVRQALAHLQDENAVIKGAFKGAAVPQYSTIGTLPKSPYSADAITKPLYAYDINAAKTLLTSHGWKVVGGVLTCQSPGTASTDCGAGIPAGTPFTFTFYYANQPAVVAQQVDAFASAAKQLGITMTLKGFTFNQLLDVANDPSSPSTESQWGMADFGGFTGLEYPTGGTIFNTGGSYNEGDYSDPTADSLMNASIYSPKADALDTESNYLGKNLPAIFQPSQDDIYVWKKTLSGPANSFSSLTQYYLSPQDWFFTK
jgi:peptide/nickel transport system substrate-binding protein